MIKRVNVKELRNSMFLANNPMNKDKARRKSLIKY